MILGIGCDIVSMKRMRHLLIRFGKRALERLLTSEERQELLSHMACKEDPWLHGSFFCAKRFAAKEACLKALGTGLSAGLSWQDILIYKVQKRPAILLKSKAQEILLNLVPEGLQPFIHVSLSDEKEFAQAFVIIEAA